MNAHEHYRQVLNELAYVASVRDAEIMEAIERLNEEIRQLQSEDAAIRSAVGILPEDGSTEKCIYCDGVSTLMALDGER